MKVRGGGGIGKDVVEGVAKRGEKKFFLDMRKCGRRDAKRGKAFVVPFLKSGARGANKANGNSEHSDALSRECEDGGSDALPFFSERNPGLRFSQGSPRNGGEGIYSTVPRT